MSGNRIAATFDALAREGRAGLVTYVTAGDPDRTTSAALLAALPAAGADLIEVGMPFTDPMADGPSIQAAGRRALAGGWKMADTLALVTEFRDRDATTPIVLMGYYNPIHAFGRERFVEAARAAGVDGLIVVDLPPEEDDELGPLARAAGLDIIRLATPTTDEARLPTVLANASGFLYYVSIAGVTGTRAPDSEAVSAALGRIRAKTRLPIAVGFGVRTAEQAAALGRVADGVVVGSAIVDAIGATLAEGGRADPERTVAAVTQLVAELAAGVTSARVPAAVDAGGAR